MIDIDARPDWVQPGMCFVDEPTGERWHIRAIVDERVVMCRWSPSKRDHYYCVETGFWFQLRVNRIKSIKKSRCFPS